MKYIITGIVLNNNLGGPSLLHGTINLIKQIDENAEIIYYQNLALEDTIISDYECIIKQNPYKNTLRYLIEGTLFRLGIKPKNLKCRELLENIKSAHAVINLWGILFCDNLINKDLGYFKSTKYILGKLLTSYLAKRYGTKTIKMPASYGPITKRTNKIQAKFATKKVFDVMFAREVESKKQLESVVQSKKDIRVLPDIANMMQCKSDYRIIDGEYVGISVSHQIVRQWKSSEGYVQCIAQLCKHVINTYNVKVVLIPNEIHDNIKYNDIHVAEDISSVINDNAYVKIAATKEISSSCIKSLLANATTVVSSRYHSCVGAISIGVPVIAVGWHVKYKELLELYGQDKYLVSHTECTPEILIDMFHSHWESKTENGVIIKQNGELVKERIVLLGKELYEPNHE